MFYSPYTCSNITEPAEEKLTRRPLLLEPACRKSCFYLFWDFIRKLKYQTSPTFIIWYCTMIYTMMMEGWTSFSSQSIRLNLISTQTMVNRNMPKSVYIAILLKKYPINYQNNVGGEYFDLFFRIISHKWDCCAS